MRDGHIVWIDVLKGYGILLVVVAHVKTGYLSDTIFLFHMPLFFFISGYLYKRNDDTILYFKKKFLHLAVPYISFLLLWNIPEYLGFIKRLIMSNDTEGFRPAAVSLVELQMNQLYGGYYLYGRHAVFWFVSCLFFTQQLYNYLFVKTNGRVLYLIYCSSILYAIAMFNSVYFSRVYFPLSINVVAMAFQFHFFGHLLSMHQDIPKRYVGLAVTVVLSTVMLSYNNILNISFSMKAQNYGLPILNIVIPLGFILLSVEVSKYVSSHKVFSNIFMALGRSSLVIMFMHQGIQLFLKQYRLLNDEIIRILISLAISYLLYRLFSLYDVSRLLFLGVSSRASYKLSTRIG